MLSHRYIRIHLLFAFPLIFFLFLFQVNKSFVVINYILFAAAIGKATHNNIKWYNVLHGEFFVAICVILSSCVELNRNWFQVYRREKLFDVFTVKCFIFRCQKLFLMLKSLALLGWIIRGFGGLVKFNFPFFFNFIVETWQLELKKV